MVGTLALVAAMSCIFVIGAIMPSYLIDYLKLNTADMGFVTSAIGFFGAAGQIKMGAISDRIGRRPALNISFGLGIVFLLLLARTGADKIPLFLLLGGLLACTLLFVATILTLFAARGAENAAYVIFDNDFYGPASTNLQAAALLLNSDAKTLGLTVVTGDGWRDEEVAHTLRLLEILGRTEVPVVPGAVYPLVSTKAKQQSWEKSFGIIPWKGAWNDPKEGLFPEYKSHGPFEIPPLDEGEPNIKAANEIAANFLIRQVHQYPHEVTIVAAVH